MGNTKPIGVAYEDQDIIGADQLYSAGELGYTAAAQGTVTQLTSKSTPVTLNESAGQITMNNASLAAQTNVAFVLNNSLLSAKDVLVVNVAGGTAATTSYNCWVSGHAAGSCTIVLRNIEAAGSPALTEAVVLNFAIIHCL